MRPSPSPFRGLLPAPHRSPIGAWGLAGILGLVVVALAPQVAAASEACSTGTWRGTLGTTTVSIELTPAEDRRPASGRYYYRAALGDLTLVRDAKTGDWQELDARETLTGRLRLSCDAKTLSGEWRSADGKKSLPIVASAIPADQFNDTRKEALKPLKVTPGQIAGRRFDTLTLPGPAPYGTGGASPEVLHLGVRLAGTEPGIAAVNASLWRAAVDAVMDHLDCRAQGRRDRGPDAGYESAQTQKVVAWNASYAVIDTWSEGYCGGAHPWHGNSVTTYRLDTGAEAEVGLWLRPEFKDEIAKSGLLGRLLAQAYAKGGNGAEADCRDEVRWRGSSIHPEPGRLVFHTQASYAMTPCAEDVSLPIDRIWPFLTPAGQQALKTFR